jgi:hypothetical protein
MSNWARMCNLLPYFMPYFRRLTAGVSTAQPDNRRKRRYQASTQLYPMVIEARSAEMTTGRSPGR